MDTINKIIDQLADAIAERIAAKLQSKPATYDLKGMAKALHLHPDTVRRMAKDGKLRTIPGTARLIFPASELERISRHER